MVQTRAMKRKANTNARKARLRLPGHVVQAHILSHLSGSTQIALARAMGFRGFSSAVDPYALRGTAFTAAADALATHPALRDLRSVDAYNTRTLKDLVQKTLAKGLIYHGGLGSWSWQSRRLGLRVEYTTRHHHNVVSPYFLSVFDLAGNYLAQAHIITGDIWKGWRWPHSREISNTDKVIDIDIHAINSLAGAILVRKLILLLWQTGLFKIGQVTVSILERDARKKNKMSAMLDAIVPHNVRNDTYKNKYVAFLGTRAAPYP